MRLLSSESISQITSVSTFSSERVRLGSGPEVLIQTVLYKRKKKKVFRSQPQFCNRKPIPQSPDIPLVTLWKEELSFVHMATGNEDEVRLPEPKA